MVAGRAVLAGGEQADLEARAATGRAFNHNGSLMLFGDPGREVESQSRSGGLPARVTAYTKETIEYPLVVLSGDANAGVFNSQNDHASGRCSTQRDRTSLRSELSPERWTTG